jgi:hypothetical protein
MIKRVLIKLCLLIVFNFSLIISNPAEAKDQLQISVGDFRVVTRSAPWAWAVAPPDYKISEGMGLKGEPMYLRPPRYMPVHSTIPALIKHPLTGDIILKFSPYHDASQEYTMTGICISRDNGWTWTPRELVKDLGVIGPLGNGWIAISYRPGYDPNNPSTPKVQVQRSVDGLNWISDEDEAPLFFPKNMKTLPSWGPKGAGPNQDYAKTLRGKYKSPASIAMHKNLFERSGILFVTGYGTFNSKGTPAKNFLMKSLDNGKSFYYVVDIGQNYEPDICWLDNGDIIALARSDTTREPRPLLQTSSKDGGKTWSKPRPAPCVEHIIQKDREWYTANGRLITQCDGALVDPALLKLPNGVIALSYGRPGLHLRFSVDGTGNYWGHKTTILPKYSVTDGKAWVFPVLAPSTHSYSAMVALSERTLLLTSNIYGYCPSGDPHKGRDVIFVVPVSVRKPADKDNLPPTIQGPQILTCKPGRKITAKFNLDDPEGDWVRLVCPRAYDIEVEANTISWRMPWDFEGQKQIRIIAEDAWGCRSEPLILKVRKKGT